MSVGYRPAPYTVPPARRGSRLLHRDAALRRLDWALLLAVLGLCAHRRRAGLSATRQAALDAGGDPHGVPEEALPQHRHRAGARRGARRLFDYRMLRAYAPVLYLLSIAGLVAVLVAARLDDQRLALVDRAARPASRSSPRSSPRSRWSSAWRCCWRRSATPRTTPRDVDVVLALAFAAVPLALVMLQPDLGTALVVCATRARRGRGVRRPAALGRRAGRRGRAGRRRGGPGRACSRTTSSTGSRRSTTRPPTRKGAGYNVRQAQIAIGSGGFARPGAVPRRADPGPASCPRSRPTSSSPWRGRSSASSAPALHRAAARRRAVAGRPHRDAAPTTCSAGWWPPACSAGSPSRPSRTSA